MDSLNVPVPGRVHQRAASLRPELDPFQRVRERPGLVCKRFERPPDVVELRDALAGTPAFEARITEIDQFEEPTRGSAPVLYFTVESPGLYRLHNRLVERFGAVSDELEGEGYDPHVTLARGGAQETADRLVGEVEPITWTVSEIYCWDAEYREPIRRISLPV